MPEVLAPEATTATADTIAAGLQTLRTAAGWAPLDRTGWLAITGEDRVRWLNGMVTNSVQALAPGDGAYTFLLSAQGRIQGDGTVWAEPDCLLLATGAAQLESLQSLLDRFIIMDDVETAPIPRFGFALAGPAAAAVLEGQNLAIPAADLRAVAATWQGHPVTVLRDWSPIVLRLEVWFDTPDAADSFTAVLSAEPATPAASFELLRILEQRPVFAADGTADLGTRDLPQETAQTRALHFSKGCYLGQEIVERIRSRGDVHRTFTTFSLTGSTPTRGTELTADGKPVGLLTTIAPAPVHGETLALGFVRREALGRGLPLSYPGGTAEARNRPAAS